MNNNILVVLAGGFGTRLKSEINNLPKALAPVHGKPFLRYLLENWLSQGINHLIFSLHYEANQIIDYVETQKIGLLKDCKVEYIIESSPLGTGGAVLNVLRKSELKSDFLLANSDTWLDHGIIELLNTDGLAISVIKVQNTSRYGEVILDASGQIVQFDEKNNDEKPGYINAGLYKLSPSIFDSCTQESFSLEKDFLRKTIQLRKIKAVVLNNSFIDIGIPEDYRRFCKWIESNKTASL